jgi:hypothetical protein
MLSPRWIARQKRERDGKRDGRESLADFEPSFLPPPSLPPSAFSNCERNEHLITILRGFPECALMRLARRHAKKHKILTLAAPDLIAVSDSVKHRPNEREPMSRKFAVVAAVCALLTTSARAETSETPHLEFVKLYIEQLGAIERIRDDAAKSFKQMTLHSELLIVFAQ